MLLPDYPLLRVLVTLSTLRLWQLVCFVRCQTYVVKLCMGGVFVSQSERLFGFSDQDTEKGSDSVAVHEAQISANHVFVGPASVDHVENA